MYDTSGKISSDTLTTYHFMLRSKYGVTGNGTERGEGETKLEVKIKNYLKHSFNNKKILIVMPIVYGLFYVFLPLYQIRTSRIRLINI